MAKKKTGQKKSAEKKEEKKNWITPENLQHETRIGYLEEHVERNTSWICIVVLVMLIMFSCTIILMPLPGGNHHG